MLINTSIKTVIFPFQLKQAKVHPIFKAGSKSDPFNLRLISILPTVSKIFEKHINKHLMEYRNKHKLLHESQSGFRHKHSCQTALIKLIDSRTECIDKEDLNGALFLDFRKASDLVDHSVLFKKLSIYRFSSAAIQWFKSYLNNRQQTIECDKRLTYFLNILSGVPQGSILGPTLFLLFTNDLPLCFDHCSSDLYADDTKVNNVNNIEHNPMCGLKNAIEWSKPTKLQLHYNGKTSRMLAVTRQRPNMPHTLGIQVNDTCLQNV